MAVEIAPVASAIAPVASPTASPRAPPMASAGWTRNDFIAMPTAPGAAGVGGGPGAGVRVLLDWCWAESPQRAALGRGRVSKLLFKLRQPQASLLPWVSCSRCPKALRPERAYLQRWVFILTRVLQAASPPRL